MFTKRQKSVAVGVVDPCGGVGILGGAPRDITNSMPRAAGRASGKDILTGVVENRLSQMPGSFFLHSFLGKFFLLLGFVSIIVVVFFNHIFRDVFPFIDPRKDA